MEQGTILNLGAEVRLAGRLAIGSTTFEAAPLIKPPLCGGGV